MSAKLYPPDGTGRANELPGVSGGGGGGVTDVTATAPITSTGGATPDIGIDDFVASGAGHFRGAVPDPGAVAGTTKFLREDATWAVPPAAGNTIATEEEGVSVDPTASTLNFTGAGVTATDAGGGVTDINIPGGGADPFAETVRQAIANAGSTTLSCVGFNFNTPSIGASPALTSTNIITSLPRVQMSSNSSGSTGSGIVNSTGLTYWFGNAAGLGGFKVEFWFGIEATHTSLSCQVGLFNSVSVLALSGGADPSGKINCMLMGADQADTEMQIMHNDGSGTCTKVPLGASFPKTAGVFYYLCFEAAANSSSVDYTVERLDSAASASGTLSSDLPSNTTFLSPQLAVGKGAVVNIVTLSAMRCIGRSTY